MKTRRGAVVVTCAALAAPLLASPSAGAAAGDATAPEISAVSPHDGSNTVYTAQTLVARVADVGSGLGADGVRFELIDQTADQSTQHTARYDTATGWARTEPVALTRGHVYRLAVSATDRAGNTTTVEHGDPTDGGGFQAITAPSAPAAGFSLGAEGEATGTPGAAPGTEQWTFEPQLVLDERIVHFAGAHHPGWGALATDVPLDGATVRFTVAGASQEVPLFTGQSRTVYQQAGYLGDGGPRDVTVAGESFGLPAVTVDLPAGAQRPSLELDGRTSEGRFGGVCGDPSTSAAGCSPDPLRFFLDPDTAARVDAEHTEQVEQSGAAAAMPNLDIGILQLLPDVTAGADIVDAGGTWEVLKPDDMVDCGYSYGYLPNVALCLVEGVLYPAPMSVVPPAYFGQFCGEVVFCATLGPAEERAARKYSCIYPRWRPYFPGGEVWYEPWNYSAHPGTDRPTYRKMDGSEGGAGSKDCQQSYLVRGPWFYTIRGETTGMRLHVFNMAWDSDWGVQDHGQDALGIHWNAPEDKGMRWAPARGDDIPQFGNKPVWASAGTALYEGVYPTGAKRTAPETPDADAAYAWRNCFTPSISAKMQWKPKDDTGIAYGIGTGDNTSKRRGWRQFRTVKCDGNYAYMRMTGGRLGAVVDQVDTVPGKHHDGHFLSTYGHETRAYRVRWGFKAGGPSCGVSAKGKPGCDPFGITFVRTEEERKNHVARKEHFNAFTYW